MEEHIDVTHGDAFLYGLVVTERVVGIDIDLDLAASFFFYLFLEPNCHLVVSRVFRSCVAKLENYGLKLICSGGVCGGV